MKWQVVVNRTCLISGGRGGAIEASGADVCRWVRGKFIGGEAVECHKIAGQLSATARA